MDNLSAIYPIYLFSKLFGGRHEFSSNTLTSIAIRKTNNLNKVPTNVFIISFWCHYRSSIPVFVGVQFSVETRMCLLHAPYMSLFIMSLMTLFAIAVDRYLAVVHSLSYKKKMTLRRATIITVVIWIVLRGLLTPLACYYSIERNVTEQGIRIVGFCSQIIYTWYS